MNESMTGVVKAVRLDKGYGFIAVPKRADIFFHMRELSGELTFDETLTARRVTFELVEADDGRHRARNVRAAV